MSHTDIAFGLEHYTQGAPCTTVTVYWSGLSMCV